MSLRKLTSAGVGAFSTWASDETVTRSLFWDAHTDRELALEFMRTHFDPYPSFMAICVNDIPVRAVTLDQGKGKVRIVQSSATYLRKHGGVTVSRLKPFDWRYFEGLTTLRLSGLKHLSIPVTSARLGCYRNHYT